MLTPWFYQGSEWHKKLWYKCFLSCWALAWASRHLTLSMFGFVVMRFSRLYFIKSQNDGVGVTYEEYIFCNSEGANFATVGISTLFYLQSSAYNLILTLTFLKCIAVWKISLQNLFWNIPLRMKFAKYPFCFSKNIP